MGAPVILARPRRAPGPGPGRGPGSARPGAVGSRWGREPRGAQPPPASAPQKAIGADADGRPHRLRV